MSSRWFRFHRKSAAPRARLICLPHAGGTASFFRDWPQVLDPSVEVIAVRYPGREDRLNEPCIIDMTALADQLADEIAMLPAEPRLPLLLFGHSMGASVAHEVTVRLERRQQPVAALLVSARPAPHRLRVNDLTKRPDDSALLSDVRRLDTRAAAVLDDPELLEVVLPAIRGDYTLVETYPRQEPRPVRAPIFGYAATADPEVSQSDVQAWEKVTTGAFELRVYSGDHFYLIPQRSAVLADIGSRVLATLLRQADPALPA